MTGFIIPQCEYFDWDDVVHAKKDFQFPTLNQAMDTDDLEFPSYDHAVDSYNAGTFPVSIQPTSTPKRHMRIDSSSPSPSFRWVQTKPEWPMFDTLSRSEWPIFETEAASSHPPTTTLPTSCNVSESPIRSRATRNIVNRTRDDIEADWGSPPARNVDFLSHNWAKEELWATGQWLGRQRRADALEKVESEALEADDHEEHRREVKEQTGCRLRNATWRAAAVMRLKLGRVDPGTFNWMKDQDDTWLYGPLVSDTSSSHPTSLVADNSELLARTILKHPSTTTLLLRGSLTPFPCLRRVTSSTQVKKRRTLRFAATVQQFTADPVALLDHATARVPGEVEGTDLFSCPFSDVMAQFVPNSEMAMEVKKIEDESPRPAVSSAVAASPAPSPLIGPEIFSYLEIFPEDRSKINTSAHQIQTSHGRIEEWMFLDSSSEHDWHNSTDDDQIILPSYSPMLCAEPEVDEDWITAADEHPERSRQFSEFLTPRRHSGASLDRCESVDSCGSLDSCGDLDSNSSSIEGSGLETPPDASVVKNSISEDGEECVKDAAGSPGFDFDFGMRGLSGLDMGLGMRLGMGLAWVFAKDEAGGAERRNSIFPNFGERVVLEGEMEEYDLVLG